MIANLLDWIERLAGLPSIIDWLVLIAFLLAGVIIALVWLGLSVRRQFRHHDRDLRSEVERTNALIGKLLLHQAGRIADLSDLQH